MAEKKRLYNWTLEFVKHRDLMLRSIIGIKEEDEYFIVEAKNKKTVYLIAGVFGDDPVNVLDRLKAFTDYSYSIVLLNTKPNLDSLTKNWKLFCEVGKNLCLIFVNPDSENDKRWMLFPHTHSLITDPKSLKPGLLAMAEMVDFVSDRDISDYI